MRIHNPEEVLAFWEEIYGPLEPYWKNKFLKHPSMKGILKNQSDSIKVAIRRNKKLSKVLDDLHKQAADKEDFFRVDLDVFLLRVFAPALGWHIADGGLKDFQ